MPQKAGKVSIQCLKLYISKVDIQLFLHILQISQSVNDQTVILLSTDGNLILIILIQDITYDLLQNILHGNNSCSLSIFVHYHGHMDFFRLHGMKKISDTSGLRDQ